MKRYSPGRNESLERMIPDLFSFECLYIGARPDRADYLDEFHKPTILEAWPDNAQYFKDEGYVVFQMDVRDLPEYPHVRYEVVMWWHGPEHVTAEQLPEVLKKLEKIATVAVVLGCPWRYFPQKAIDGNKYEEHLNHIEYEDLEALGYEVECLGEIDQRGSNITAVKYV